MLRSNVVLSPEQEIAELRAALITIGRKLGCLLADTVSTGFIVDNVPGELELVINKLKSDGFKSGINCAAEVCYHAARLVEKGAPESHPYESLKYRQRAAEILAILPGSDHRTSYESGVRASAEVCFTAARLARTVIETNCFDVAELYDVRGYEILALLKNQSLGATT
jgi:hypothetical protein